MTMSTKLVTMSIKLVTMSALVGALTTCSDTQFNGFSNNPPVKAGAKTSDASKTVDDNSANEPPLRDAGGGTRPTATCTNGSTVQSDTQELIFKKPQASCQWNSSGNIAVKNGHMTARTLQTVEASLPVGAILCGMQLKSQSGTLRYDDAFFLMADEYMILNSWNSFTQYFEKDGSLIKWSWDRIVGKGYVNGGDKPFCFGSAKSCVVPPTETVGSFDVRFGDDDIFALGQKIANDGKIDFTLATTGDDNSGLDCMHTELNMTVTFLYVN